MEDGLVKVPSSGLSVDWVHWTGVSFMTVPGQERQRGRKWGRRLHLEPPVMYFPFSPWPVPLSEQETEVRNS